MSRLLRRLLGALGCRRHAAPSAGHGPSLAAEPSDGLHPLPHEKGEHRGGSARGVARLRASLLVHAPPHFSPTTWPMRGIASSTVARPPRPLRTGTATCSRTD